MINGFPEVRFIESEVKTEWKEISASPLSEMPKPESLLLGARRIDPETGAQHPVQLLIKAKTLASIMEVVNGNHA